MDIGAIRQQLAAILDDTPTADIHTHVYSEAFGELLLWGIDELLSYQYLIAELFREGNPVGVKAAMQVLGRDSGEMRLPLCPIGDENMERMRRALKSYGLLP